ncbi:MAG: glucans biosynthesis glucosyltransferase MdoH [Wenzhouxiangella sp.]|nr:MAG: glucans biosynthesis glucosyltransferase MdoH [Wenzhouxiangella sp.]
MSGTRKNSIATFDRRRRLFLALVGGTGLAGLVGLFLALAEAGVGLIARVPLAVLFALTFTWIAVSFWHAVIGFVSELTQRARSGSAEMVAFSGRPRPHRTVVVMPIHNEDPDRVVAGLRAMAESLVRSNAARGFEFFVLSDTRDALVLRAERSAIAALQAELDDCLPLHYRHRPDKRGRKAGNLADFCRRWGRRYQFMLVLDADSVMDASCMQRLVAAMQRDPGIGLIQTVPIPAGQTSLFARLVQFAAALYSPMLARGQAFWQGPAGNYWGHNALVRMSAFMDACGLPELPGRPPLGGEILSHDFVEAALLRRAGWKVELDTARLVSHEEVPANLIDYAARDRRWMQGNLQHLKILRMPGLHPASRLHFLFGAAAYLSSLAWLGLLLLGAATMALHSTVASDPSGGPGGYGLAMLVATLVLLFGPRLLGLGLALLRRPEAFGGRLRLACSGLLEALAGILLAPVMMLFHARFALEILSGSSAGWSSPPRGDRPVAAARALARTWVMAIAGLVWLVLAAILTPQYLWWMSPVWLGLLLAPLAAWVSGSRALGLAVRRPGLLLTPSETSPPEVLQAAFRCRPQLTRGLAPWPPPAERPGPMPTQRVLPDRDLVRAAAGYDRVRA